MAINYNIQDIIDCINVMHPILADTIADTALARLVELGSDEDPFACKWRDSPPKSCNVATIFKVIADTTNIADLQWMQACASVVAAAIDEESTSSRSSDSASSVSTSTSSLLELFDCVLYQVKTPQYYETGSSTATIIMDPLAGNTHWDDVKTRGNLNEITMGLTGGPGTFSVNQNTGEVTYIPLPDGSEAGTLVYAHLRYIDRHTGCSVDVYLHLVITEETSTAT